MKKHFRISLLTIICSLFILVAAAQQDRFGRIEAELKNLAQTSPGLKETVELSVTGVSIQEFIRGLATAHNLNVSVDPSIKIYVVNNFYDATVSDVLLFLCKQHNMDISFIGSIMSFSKYSVPPEEPKAYVPKKLKISYNNQTDFLSFDLKKDSLFAVAKEITAKSLKNVVLSPDLENKIVSGYIQNRPFADALDKLAFANDLVVNQDGNFYLIEPNERETVAGAATAQGRKSGRQPGVTADNENLTIKLETGERITVQAFDVPVVDVVQGVSAELFKNYFLFSEPKGNTTLYIENATYDDFLTYILNGSDYTYKIEDNVYLVGERKLERLRATEIVSLQNRTIETILDKIPAELKQDVDIQEFIELNALILSGSLPKINEIKNFLRDIDRLVPMVMIDVMIVDYKKTRTLSTGIKMGVGEAPAKPGGTIWPNVDFNLSTESINDLIGKFNGIGFINLGKVTPEFYLSIQALEDDGILNARSTPRLATINGHETTLSIGETEYYLETQNTVIGTQNPQNVVTQQYKSVNADLSITIKPIVSGDDQVTMEISVKQSDFTARISPNAPPGSVTRDFKSFIRVKDQEMILLGGLEEKSSENSGSGLPLLSRIPIIKWLFSNRTKKDSKSQLNIFIKPTIIY
ncbi:MAG: general secretion pathway protein GspD [Flavobacteriales bacterium]|nr:MAG: general secretion pathway protein GspD [Flavobacteriales bacterium]